MPPFAAFAVAERDSRRPTARPHALNAFTRRARAAAVLHSATARCCSKLVRTTSLGWRRWWKAAPECPLLAREEGPFDVRAAAEKPSCRDGIGQRSLRQATRRVTNATTSWYRTDCARVCGQTRRGDQTSRKSEPNPLASTDPEPPTPNITSGRQTGSAASSIRARQAWGLISSRRRWFPGELGLHRAAADGFHGNRDLT